MQREISELTPDLQNPAISRVSFADGGQYNLPTAQIMPLYEQQMKARTAQMMAQRVPDPDANIAQDVQPQMYRTPQQASTIGGWKPDIPTGQVETIAPLPEPAKEQPKTEQRQPMSRDVAEVNAIRAAGHPWTLRDEAEYQLHPDLTRAQMLAHRTPGSYVAPVTQADLQRRAAQGVALPVGTSTTIQGKAPVSEQDLANITDARVKAATVEAQAAEVQAKAQRDAAAFQAFETQNELEKQKAEAEAREADWRDKWDKFERQADPTSEQNQVNPNRWFQQRGVLGGALAVIGHGMQSFANYYMGNGGAPTTVERMIDRDIRAQEVDIQTKRGAAQNQLMQLSQQFGSIDAGKAALKIAQRQAIDAKLEAIKQARMAPADAARIDAFREQNRAAITDEIARLKALYGGSINETVQSQVAYPRAGGYSGPRYNLKGLEGASQTMRGEARKDLEAQGKIGEKAQERAERLGERVSQLNGALDSAQEYWQSIGLVRDPQSGKWVMPAGADNPLMGPWDATGGRWSERAQVARQARANAVEAFGRAQSGAAISEEESKRFETMVAGESWGGAAAAANEMERALRNRMKYTRAGAGAEASELVTSGVKREERQGFQRNLQEAQVQPYTPGTR